MGNHTVDCPYCGEDLRSTGHAKDCPGPAYEAALREYQRREFDYMVDSTAIWRQALEVEEADARKRYRQENPPPVEPPQWGSKPRPAPADPAPEIDPEAFWLNLLKSVPEE